MTNIEKYLDNGKYSPNKSEIIAKEYKNKLEKKIIYNKSVGNEQTLMINRFKSIIYNLKEPDDYTERKFYYANNDYRKEFFKTMISKETISDNNNIKSFLKLN